MKKLIVLCLVSVMMLPACAEMTGPQTNTGKGAVYGTAGGAAAGALAGQLIGRNTKSTLIGAAIGAAVGGVAGASIGQMMDKQEAAFRQALDSQSVEIRRVADQQAAASYDQRTANGQQQQAPPQIIALTLKGDVFFKTGSAEVSSGAYGDIDRIAQVMTQYPQTTITVEGHTDSTGNRTNNQILSERRAQSVASLLSQRGVEYSRITTVGYGQDRPVASNNDAGGRQLNRRVEIRIRPMSAS
jgi:outer membrane protein OmpA-like peptidoglycan-associated protein